MRMRKIRGYKQLIMNMSFRTFAMDGILLYNGQNMNGEGDFLSLAIKGGFVEFRLDYSIVLVITYISTEYELTVLKQTKYRSLFCP